MTLHITILGSILREEMPTEVKAKKQRARKSTGDGTGLVNPFYRLLLRTCNISSDNSDILFFILGHPNVCG